MEIDAGLCRLRPYRMDDLEALVHIADDRQVWRNLTDRFPHPYTEADAREWLAGCKAEGEPTTRFAVEVQGELAGGAGIEIGKGERAGSAVIGYWLGRRFWGRGFATAAVQALTRYGFEALDIHRIEATVFGWNRASARVLEKAGFQREGSLRQAILKDGERTDLLLFGLLRN